MRTQVKIFPINNLNEREINDWLNQHSHEIGGQGINIGEKAIIIFYDVREPESEPGYSRHSQLLMVEAIIRDLQKDILSTELEFRFWSTQNFKKIGGKGRLEEVQAKVFQAEKTIENLKEQIRHAKALYEEIKSDKFEI